MELGRSAWIRRERLERIANAERDRRAGRTALAIASIGEAVEWPARVVLALAELPADEGIRSREILEEGLDLWALESGLPALDELELSVGPRIVEPAIPAFEEFSIELDRPIESGELERAFEEATAEVEVMHDANRVAERVLFAEPFDLSEVGADAFVEDLDPLEMSARRALANAAAGGMDAASVPDKPAGRRSGRATRADAGDAPGKPSRAFVLATLERWLQNLERARAGGMR
jgi:hypothetical protein